ncbi:ATP-binding protein [Streptomyces sp. NPDC058701]|uniref:ATP-binding protein n=1 Tax=Streptomyces sp. NPDC058701 TaxID=3346608 RepID=UPI0036510F63
MEYEGRQHPELSQELPATVAQARARVRDLVDSMPPERAGTDEGLTDLLLVTSELATNAIRHGGGLTGFGVRMEADGIVLTVVDASPRMPVALLREEGYAGPGGFGWPLICRLAKDVAITPLPGGGKSIEVLMPLR